MPPDVHLEHVGAALRELANGIGGIRARRLDRVLVDHTIASAAEREREHRHDRRAGAQRQRGDRRRRGGRTVEEVHVDGVAAHDVLIDEHRDAVSRLQRPHDAPNRPSSIHDRVARALTDALQQAIEMRVVERARQDGDRLHPERVNHRLQFPEAEVAGDEQHAPALRIGEARSLFAVELDARQHLRRGQRPEPEQLEQQPAEMRERRAGDGASLGRPPRGKRGGQIPLRDAAMPAIDPIEREPEDGAAGAHERAGHHAHQRDQQTDDQVFQTVSHRMAD